MKHLFFREVKKKEYRYIHGTYPFIQNTALLRRAPTIFNAQKNIYVHRAMWFFTSFPKGHNS